MKESRPPTSGSDAPARPPSGSERSGGPALDSRVGVTLAAGLLVAATWIALTLAPAPGGSLEVTGSAGSPPGSPPGSAAVTTRFDSLPGLRADLFALPDDDMSGFVAVPGGPFIMGSHPGQDPLAFETELWGDGRAQGAPELDAFWVARYEVTRAQYRAFVAASGHPITDPSAIRGGGSLPVTHVAWTDAIAYAQWLDGALRASSAAPAPLAELLADGWRVDLLNEAQWEKAARGTDGRIYPWGDAFEPGRANVNASGPRPVGSMECGECAHGLHDMAGNVWEWTRSPYQPYPFSDDDDLATTGADALWVMRGGSWSDAVRHARAANRGAADPGSRLPFIGFRIGLTR